MLLFILTASLNSDVCVCVCVCVCVFSHVFAVLWTVALQAHLSLEFSSKEYWSGLPFPTPGDLTQGWNWSLLHLLLWRVDSLPMCHMGN